MAVVRWILFFLGFGGCLSVTAICIGILISDRLNLKKKVSNVFLGILVAGALVANFFLTNKCSKEHEADLQRHEEWVEEVLIQDIRNYCEEEGIKDRNAVDEIVKLVLENKDYHHEEDFEFPFLDDATIDGYIRMYKVGKER